MVSAPETRPPAKGDARAWAILTDSDGGSGLGLARRGGGPQADVQAAARPPTEEAAGSPKKNARPCRSSRPSLVVWVEGLRRGLEPERKVPCDS